MALVYNFFRLRRKHIRHTEKTYKLYIFNCKHLTAPPAFLFLQRHTAENITERTDVALKDMYRDMGLTVKDVKGPDAAPAPAGQ